MTTMISKESGVRQEVDADLLKKYEKSAMDPRFVDFHRNPDKTHPSYFSGMRLELPPELMFALIASSDKAGDGFPCVDLKKLEVILKYLNERAK